MEVSVYMRTTTIRAEMMCMARVAGVKPQLSIIYSYEQLGLHLRYLADALIQNDLRFDHFLHGQVKEVLGVLLKDPYWYSVGRRPR